VILEMLVSVRAKQSMFRSEAGRQIDFNDVQSEPASVSIRISIDTDSNANYESNLHDLKEPAPRHSTEAGRQIDSNELQPGSALASIRVSFDPNSNVNDESDSQ
jgi:hypothetical protein